MLSMRQWEAQEVVLLSKYARVGGRVEFDHRRDSKKGPLAHGRRGCGVEGGGSEERITPAMM